MIEISEMDTMPIAGYWQLPEGWEWTPVKDLCTEIGGGGTPSTNQPEYFGGHITWVTPSDLDINDPVQQIVESQKTLTQAGLDHSSAKFLPVGTVLFSSRATIGKIALAGVPLCTNQGFVNFVCKSEQLNNHYLSWCLRVLTEEIKKLAGSTTYQEVSRSSLRHVLIPLPFPKDKSRSLDIQRRIVHRIEALLAELREAQNTLESMRQDIDQVIDSVLSEVFSETNENWPNKAPLGELVTISAHQVDPQNSDYKWLPHIGGENIKSKTCRIGIYQTAEEDQVTSGKYLFEPGVILYSKIRPYLRKVAIADFRGLCSADIYPLSIRTDKQNELLPRFLMWSMVAGPFTNYANAKSGRARMPKINRQELFSYELFFPGKTEQQYIINYLDSTQENVDSLLDMLQEDTEILQKVEQSILERAFRGKL